MKGRQLVCIRRAKNKSQSVYESPVGYIRGVSEDIQIVSPRDRKLKNQIYLKSISPVGPLTKPIVSNSSSIIESFPALNDPKQITNASHFTGLPYKKEKIFKIDPNSRFSVHFHEEEEKRLQKLNHELFPKEFCENIEYLPDYTHTRLINHIELNKTDKDSMGNSRIEPRTITNLVKSRQEVRKIDMEKLKKSRFTTYSTGWGSFYERNKPNSPRKFRISAKSVLPEIFRD